MIFNSRTVCNSIESNTSILVETSISDKGIPVFEIYGLISKSIEESKKRIVTAFNSSQLQFPLKNISINLSPAELVKDGTYFDLSIAASILQYTHGIKVNSGDVFIGELSFDGSIRRVSSLVFLVLVAQELGFKRVFVPSEQLNEVNLSKDIEVIPISNLTDLLNIQNLRPVTDEYYVKNSPEVLGTRFNQIVGNEHGKKVLSYCIAGKHNLLIEGFPGVGKSLLAKAACELLPSMDTNKALSLLKMYSYLGISRKADEITRPPFRSPHSSSSYSAIFGTTGNKIYPGELALSDNGVLFLDEFPEFNRLVIEGLRSPMEDKFVSISRGKKKVTFPCDFILIATQNPCKCGYFNHPKIDCRCTPSEISKYKSRISGPILDRIDIHYSFTDQIYKKVSIEQSNYSNDTFENYRNKIKEVRSYLQEAGFAVNSTFNDSKLMSNISLQKRIRNDVHSLVSSVQEKYSISNRKIFKILNLSFTISLFKNKEEISVEDFFEALNLTSLIKF